MDQCAFSMLAREVVTCRQCFEVQVASPAQIDIAQPRWVGSNYEQSRPRILFLLVNPASGKGYNEAADATFLKHLRAFRDDAGSLETVLEHQRRDMPSWGRGRFFRFYIEQLGLSLDDVAFINIAWCSVANNKPLKPMLNTCFNLHTKRLLQILQPQLIFVSGSAAHPFSPKIRNLLPTATVQKVLHYAHRKGTVAEKAEAQRMRAALEHCL